MLAHAVVLLLMEVVFAAVGLEEVELLLAVPQLELARNLFHVGRRHVVLLVIEVEGANARDVGRHRYLVVGDAHGCPHGAHLLGTSAEDLENPHLVGVGNGEALATVGVAIFLGKATHGGYRVAGCGAALQGYALEFLDVEHARLVAQRVATANGGLAHRHLLLVHAGIGGVEVAVGVAHLGNGALNIHLGAVACALGVHAALVDGGHRVALVVACRCHGHPGAVPRVAGVRRHHRAVGAGVLAHHDTGARQPRTPLWCRFIYLSCCCYRRKHRHCQ